jgi:hypothetical protein
VGGADPRSFASDLLETSQQELSKASGIFDLTENGFNDLLAQSITTFTDYGIECLKQIISDMRSFGQTPGQPPSTE